MKLEININGDKISLGSSEPIQLDDLMSILFTLQLSAMENFIKDVQDKATPEELQILKEDIYDKFNAGASNVLYLFAPDTELHPDLTVEAMKEAEDNYMKNHTKPVTIHSVLELAQVTTNQPLKVSLEPAKDSAWITPIEETNDTLHKDYFNMHLYVTDKALAETPKELEERLQALGFNVEVPAKTDNSEKE